MLEYQVRPIDTWPGEQTRGRMSSSFRANWPATLDLLEKEITQLRGKEVVLQLDVKPADIRNDGQLRGDARPASPRVILSFDSKHGPLSYPCDRFVEWRSNVRAIALALEALRAVDRYGVTRQAEQYKGWAKLPAPGAPMGTSEAAAILAEHSGLPAAVIYTVQATFVDAYRKAASRTHPDAGGSPEDAKRVNAAQQVLERHFSRA